MRSSWFYVPGTTMSVLKRQIMVILVVLIAVLLTLPSPLKNPSLPSSAPAVAPGFDGLPVSFVPNAGQTDPEVRFAARALGGRLFFTRDEVVLALPGISSQTPTTVAGPDVEAGVVSLRFDGANSVEPVGVEQLPGVANYYVGGDPAMWRANIPTYAGVVYRQLYPGIDLRYEGAAGSLKGTYTVAPGANPELIRWRYDGASDLRVDEKTGDLIVSSLATRPGLNQLPGAIQDSALAAQFSSLVELTPVAWQSIGGQQVPVDVSYVLYTGAGTSGDVRYVLSGDMAAPTVGFALGPYDTALPLTIDPILAYSTYLGGGDNDVGSGIALDGSGNMYIVGKTASANFPGAPGGGELNGDVFVTKLNAAGTAVAYTTYLGGSQQDDGRAIALDSSGNAYVVGETSSTDFPTVNPVQASYAGLYDGFIAKLGPSGTIAYSTYLGTDREDALNDLAVDSSGNVYATGYVDGYFASAVKISPAGALVYWVSFGPTAYGSGSAVAIDGQGNAYFTGSTSAESFPTTPNALQSACGKPTPFSSCSHDAFVLKLNAAGNQILYSTYLGGNYTDQGNAISLDAAGNIYIAGQTQSKDFPTKNAVQPGCELNGDNCEQDAFAVKIKADGSELVYSTYLGGTWNDFARGIAVDSTGNAYVVGATCSLFFPNPGRHSA